MKRTVLCFLLVSLFLLSGIIQVFAAPASGGVEFRATNVYLNSDNQIIVEGKFWNFGDTPRIIDKEHLQVIYTSDGNTYGTYSNPVEFANLNIEIKPDEVIHYSFTCPTLPAVPIISWRVTPNTFSH